MDITTPDIDELLNKIEKLNSEIEKIREQNEHLTQCNVGLLKALRMLINEGTKQRR